MGGLSLPSWHPEGAELSAAGCFVVFPRGRSGPGVEGDAATTAAVIVRDGRVTAARIVHGHAGAPYTAGLLYLREGQLLEEVVLQLPERPDVLAVNGTGLDRPRRAGMALHLGYLLDLSKVGVTHRPLCADGWWPDDERGSISPLTHDGQIVSYWVRTRYSARPLVAHGAWRTSPETAAEVGLAVTTRFRTSEPLRLARQVARTARAGVEQVV